MSKDSQLYENKKRSFIITFLVFIGCGAIAINDAFVSPDYIVKCVLKFILFLGLPLIYLIYSKDTSFRHLFKGNRTSVGFALLMGALVYIFIMTCYFLLGPYFDFTNVTVYLENDIGVNKDNFIITALYIAFINSFLEEFFFRGFAFVTLKKVTSQKTAYIFSAALFSMYHIAMMTSWSSLSLLLLFIVSLFISGLLFNYLNEKNGNIYVSWMVHMFANFAINTVGCILFGIIDWM
jgi:membrane protease YdiL (CAAX protease family)